LFSLVFAFFSLLLIVLFGLIGWFRGIKAALRNFCVVAAAAVFAVPAVSFTVNAIAGGELFGLKLKVLDAVLNAGARGLAAERVILGTLDNFTRALITPVMFTAIFLALSILLFVLKSVVMAILRKKRVAEVKPLDAKSRGAGAVLGLVTALLFGMLLTHPLYGLSEAAAENRAQLAPLIGGSTAEAAASLSGSPGRYIYKYTGAEALGNLFFGSLPGGLPADEIARFSSIAGTLNLLSAPEGHYAELCAGVSEFVSIYFESELFAGSESDKLSLINKALKKQLSDLNVDMLGNFAEAFSYGSASALTADLRSISSLAELLETRGILDALLNNFESGFDVLSKLSAEDTTEIAGLLYGLEISDFLTRAVLSEFLGALSDSGSYVYPKDIRLIGTDADFAALLAILPKLAVLTESGTRIGSMSEAERIEFIDDVNTLKSSPLLPAEVFALLQRKVRELL
jgi:hypothetical protein